MTHFAGLDVSKRKTQVCIIDGTGEVLIERKIDTNPDILAQELKRYGWHYTRVGLEAGPMSQWLYEGMARLGLPMIAVETKAANGFLKSQRVNKTDRNDARGIAQLMQIGPKFYKEVHIKTRQSQDDRALLGARMLMSKQLCQIEGSIRSTLMNVGIKIPAIIGHRHFVARVVAAAINHPQMMKLIDPLLDTHGKLWEQFCHYQAETARRAKADPICRQLMTMPGVGPYVALTFKSAIDVPERFSRSRSVAASIGLTPLKYQSGEIDVSGRISKAGDATVRAAMVEAAVSCMNAKRNGGALYVWAHDLAARKGVQKARVALARKMTVILHRMWLDGCNYDETKLMERFNELPPPNGGGTSAGTNGRA